ncbi:MAG: PAS domain S-box protein [Lachnospiraceae bacterium]|nr:PAS domain S-box protein [Lachnospiraceae bacterium]
MDYSAYQSKMDLVFKNLDDSVCITEKTGTLSYANDAAIKLFGISPKHLGKEKIWKTIPYVETNDDLIQVFIDATVAKEKTIQQIVSYEKNDGSVCQLRVNITYTNEDENEFFVIVITNLTELFRVNAAFARYTSAEIADYVLNTPEGEKQGGKSKDVTILMSDLRGFTAMSAKLTPKQLITGLNHYFEQMCDAINKYHGTVIEFLGDGIFVVFGAPKDDPDHAQNAVLCALEMENAMKEVNKWNEENDFPLLEMGIGINSGKCVVGNIGSAEKMKYGCMGDTVNIAGRTESFTVGGQIYVTKNTADLIDQKLTISEEQSFMPKGAKKEIQIYSIVGLGDLKLSDYSQEIRWQNRSSSVDITFRELEGKAVGDQEYQGVITDLSADERYARLLSENDLPLLMNLMIDIGGFLYAKITEKQKEGYLICFTSKPDNFKEWAGWE